MVGLCTILQPQRGNIIYILLSYNILTPTGYDWPQSLLRFSGAIKYCISMYNPIELGGYLRFLSRIDFLDKERNMPEGKAVEQPSVA